MENLFWYDGKDVRSLLATPFKSEDEFERTIFDATGLLSDVYLLKRQVKGGQKNGIPDIIGLDSDGNICIVEMKNIRVDAAILPQVLGYAFWAETNPDSIRALWLEKKNRPELTIEWDNIKVKIIIVAPRIDRSALDLVKKIAYDVDLIEITRWSEANSNFLLVSKLEPNENKKIKPTSGLPEYNEEFYKSLYNPESVDHFIRITQLIDEFIQKRKWGLQMKYNKSYCGYKAGFFNAFGVKWLTSRTLALFFKLSEDDARQIKEMTKYEPLWKEATYVIPTDLKGLGDYDKLFEAAYKRISG